MTIDKAIDILEEMLGWQAPDDMPKQGNAIKLGIEALKRLKATSPYPHEYLGGPLPGESN